MRVKGGRRRPGLVPSPLGRGAPPLPCRASLACWPTSTQAPSWLLAQTILLELATSLVSSGGWLLLSRLALARVRGRARSLPSPTSDLAWRRQLLPLLSSPTWMSGLPTSRRHPARPQLGGGQGWARSSGACDLGRRPRSGDRRLIPLPTLLPPPPSRSARPSPTRMCFHARRRRLHRSSRRRPPRLPRLTSSPIGLPGRPRDLTARPDRQPHLRLSSVLPCLVPSLIVARSTPRTRHRS